MHACIYVCICVKGKESELGKLAFCTYHVEQLVLLKAPQQLRRNGFFGGPKVIKESIEQ